eukprot:PITA_21352
MFWADAVLCATYIKNRCPSSAIRNNTPYESWYGHVPSVKHLRIFGSTCYALIPKVHRNKLGARSCKCIFLGYLNTSKAYRLYDEENRKFVISRDVIFLESSKSDNVVERKLDRLDRFAKTKSFQEFENQKPHLEGGISIIDQHVESSSEEYSPPIETPTTDDALSDILNQLPSKKLLLAMEKEYGALIKNGTWKLDDLPLGTKPIGCKWVYKDKYKVDGSLEKQKARLVAKGFAQKEGVDYEETFAPIAK